VLNNLLTILFSQADLPPTQKALRSASARSSETDHRARFSYDDLLALFNC
jgi:hypothetical protein